jgi:hypothetical protein
VHGQCSSAGKRVFNFISRFDADQFEMTGALN